MDSAEPCSVVDRDAAVKLCPSCEEAKPSDAFSPDDSKPDGLARLCKPCRADAARAKRAARAAMRLDGWHDIVDPLDNAPFSGRRGPEGVEPGAIVLAVEELAAAPSLVRFPGMGRHELPAALRPHAASDIDGVLRLPRTALLDFVGARRRRVGEYAMVTVNIPRDLSLTARERDTADEHWAHRRAQQSDN